MTIQQMIYFVTLCQCGSFSKAANQLFISQPAVSKQLSALEKELDILLLDRKKGGKFQITPSGEIYYQTFCQILKDLETTAFHVRYASAGTDFIYKIGILEGWMMQDYVSMCHENTNRAFADIKLHFEFLPPDKLNRMKDSGDLDFILTIDPAYENTRDYVKESVCSIHSVLYTAMEHPAVENGRLNPGKLGPDLYILSEQEVAHIHISQITDLIAPQQPVIHPCMSFNSALMNVLAGQGAAITDEWSLPAYSERFSAYVLSDTQVPVIYARKNTGDAGTLSVYGILKDTLAQWKHHGICGGY